jgi:DNA polymerase iota
MFNLDASRVVAVFDADYFYCQVELNAVGDESLRSKPAAVFQKHLVVTCNYEARKYGVGKLMRVDEAKRLCPELVLFCGEDLTPYRDAQERICEALEEKLRSLDEVGREHRCETVGLDEYIFELTAVVDRRLRSMNAECAQKGPLNEYVGAVFPRDFMPESLQPDICLVGPEEELRLALGSDIAKNMRDAAFERTGITISCGVGFNKMLAKFAANMHKPNGQTTFVPTVRADSWLSELELRSFLDRWLRSANFK